MRQHRLMFLLLAVLGVLLPATASFAQGPSVFLGPDNRYEGYPRELRPNWPAAQPELKACVDSEYYEPLDTHLTRYQNRVKVARVRVQDYDECTWMLTRNKWRWVLRPKGTKVAVDAQGRDLFDLGSEKGLVCANPRPVSIPILPPPPLPLPPQPRVRLAPPPAPVILPVTVLWTKRTVNQKGNLVQVRDLPKEYRNISFLATTPESQVPVRFNGTDQMAIEGVMPGTTLVLWEVSGTLPKKTTDTTKRLIITVPADAVGEYRAPEPYVNTLRQGGPCGPIAIYCWGPPLGGLIIWRAAADKPPSVTQPPPVDREPTKGGTPTVPGAPTPPSNPGPGPRSTGNGIAFSIGIP